MFLGMVLEVEKGLPPGKGIWLQGAPFINLNRLPRAWQHRNGHNWISSEKVPLEHTKNSIALVGLVGCVHSLNGEKKPAKKIQIKSHR